MIPNVELTHVGKIPVVLILHSFNISHRWAYALVMIVFHKASYDRRYSCGLRSRMKGAAPPIFLLKRFNVVWILLCRPRLAAAYVKHCHVQECRQQLFARLWNIVYFEWEGDRGTLCILDFKVRSSFVVHFISSRPKTLSTCQSWGSYVETVW